MSERYQASKKVTLIGGLVNIVLAAVKLIVGFIGNSPALIADGIHSLSDLISDGLVLVAAKFSNISADDNHPYGHQRIETLATVALGVFLIFVGIGIGYDAVVSIVNHNTVRPDSYTLYAAGFSILANEAMFHYTNRVGKRINSQLITANAWHHRSDALSSVIVLLGIIGALLGYVYCDAIAATIVALFIIKMGVKFAWVAAAELSDEGLTESELKPIKTSILDVDGVLAMHQLRTRKMADKVYLDVHIQISPYTTGSEGHFISETVHYKLLKQFKDVADVTVHVDVDDHMEGFIQKHLPGRTKLLAEFLPIWQQILPDNAIQDIRLHYIKDKVEIELVLNAKNLPVNKDKLVAELKQSIKSNSDVSSLQVLLG